MEELLRALGPWPIFQGVLIGLIVASVGAWAFKKGLISLDKEDDIRIEDRRQEWQAYQQLQNIEQNTFKMVSLLERLLDTVVRYTNNGRGRPQ